jgi:L-lactate utilization protein LutB
MDESTSNQNEATARYMVKMLQNKGFTTYYAKDLQTAKNTILQLLPENALVGLGGSVTLEQMNILPVLRTGKYKLIDRYKEASPQQHIQYFKDALLSDYFLTGANAITKKGEIVCTDCSGNRIAAMIFGPEKVIVAVGINKLVEDLPEAMRRIKKIAPINAKRNNHQTPCILTGKCENCNQPESMCNYTGIIHNGNRFKGRITVIVIGMQAGL